MSTECPNVGKLLANLEFTLPLESEIMGKILDDGEDPDDGGGGVADGQPRHPRRSGSTGSPPATAATGSRRCAPSLGV